MVWIFDQFKAIATNGMSVIFFKLNNKKTANKMLTTSKIGNPNPKYENHTNLEGFTYVAINANINKTAKKIAKLLNKIQPKFVLFFDLKSRIICKVTKKIVILQVKWANEQIT